MEMLRIESKHASKAFIKFAKLYWLQFDGAIYVDGIMSKNNFSFMGNEQIVPNLHNFGLSNKLSAEYGFMALFKAYPEPEFKINSNINFRFACQKWHGNFDQEYNFSTDKLEVDVESRILKKIGSIKTYSAGKEQKITYFQSRTTNFTPLSASMVCNSLSMKLFTVKDKESFHSLVTFLIKDENTFNDANVAVQFFIGGTRSSLIESNPWVNIVNPYKGKLGNCLALDINKISGKPLVLYFVCNQDYIYNKMKIICVKTEEKSTLQNQYRNNFKVHYKNTIGLELLGKMETGK